MIRSSRGLSATVELFGCRGPLYWRCRTECCPELRTCSCGSFSSSADMLQMCCAPKTSYRPRTSESWWTVPVSLAWNYSVSTKKKQSQLLINKYLPGCGGLSWLHVSFLLHVKYTIIVVYPYPRRFILMTSCRTEMETVSRMQKVWPFDCYCSHHQWRGVAVSLLVSGLTVDILSTFCGGFMVHCVTLMLRIFFWIWGFIVWLFCLSLKCNLFETFYQVWALHRWGARHNHRQTRGCLLNRCAEN